MDPLPLVRGAAVQQAAREGEARVPVVRAPLPAAGAGPPSAFDNPEARPLAERCLLGFGSTSGPPTLPNYFYNNLKQIVQTPTTVTIALAVYALLVVLRNTLVAAYRNEGLELAAGAI